MAAASTDSRLAVVVGTSGGGSHPTRKRSHSSDSQPPTACVVENVELTLAFHDGGTIHRDYKTDIIHDTRPPINEAEALELVRDLKADIVVRPGTFDTKGLAWNVTTNSPWQHSTPMQTHPLSGCNNAITTTLRRSTPHSVEVFLILVRIIKGKATAHPSMFFGADARRQVMFGLFDMLLEYEQPVLIVGNFGMSVYGIVRYVQEYKNYTGSSRLADRIQILPNKDQELLCLSLGTSGRSRSVVQVDAELCPPRMFVVQLGGDTVKYTDGSSEHLAGHRPEHERKKAKFMIKSRLQAAEAEAAWKYSIRDATEPLDDEPWDYGRIAIADRYADAAADRYCRPWQNPCRMQIAIADAAAPPVTLHNSLHHGEHPDETSDGAHLTGNNRPLEVTDKPRAQVLIELLSDIASREPEESNREKWASYMRLNPVVTSIHRKDGTQVIGPVDITATLQVLEIALKIAEEARKHVGVTSPDRTLSDDERGKANRWLQHECFEPHFMINTELKQMITLCDANPDAFGGARLKQLREKRRGAFKVWKFGLLGNTPLFHTVVSSGIFHPGDQRRFLLAFLKEKENKPAPVSEALQEARRTAAKKARSVLKRAKKIELLVKIKNVQLKKEQELLLRRLDSGELEQARTAADLAYGHGKGLSYKTVHDATLFKMSMIQMDEFRNREVTQMVQIDDSK